MLTGLTPVKVYMDDAAHRWADVDNASAARLLEKALRLNGSSHRPSR